MGVESSASLLAQGGPPLLTDDPGTPGAGGWEINLAFAVERSRIETVWEAPLLDLNYGLGDRCQLKFEVPWVILEEDDEGSRNGLGNSTVGLKWRFLDQERHWIDMSIYPQFEFNNPTCSADRGLVDGGTQLLLPVQVAVDFGWFSLNPELGYALHEEDDESLLLALALGFEALPGRLDLLGEVHSTMDQDFEEETVVFNLGARVAVTEWLRVLASAGRSLRHPEAREPELLAYFGLQFLFGGSGSASTRGLDEEAR